MTRIRPSTPHKETAMRGTSRLILVTLAAASMLLSSECGQLVAQFPPTPPPPPQPAEIPNPAGIHPSPQAGAAAKRARLQQDEKEFREGVERLYQLTGELREEVQKT